MTLIIDGTFGIQGPNSSQGGIGTSITVASLNDLKALTSRPPSVVMQYRTVNNDDGGGTFIWYPGDSSGSNDGTIIQCASGPSGRYKRLYNGAINVKWFGAKGDGITDDSVAINAALALLSPVGGGTIFFPPNIYPTTYKCKDIVITGQDIWIQGKGAVLEPVTGAKWLLKTYRTGRCGIEDITFSDPNYITIKNTTTTGVVNPTTTAIPVSSSTNFEPNQIVALTLSSGVHHVTTIGSVSSGIINVIDGVPYTATSVSIANGGSGYAVNDVIMPPGLNGIPPTFKVTSVSGGAITGLSILCPGRLLTAPSNPVSMNDGSGSGSTINITWSGMNSGAIVEAAYGLLSVDQTQSLTVRGITFQIAGVGLHEFNTTTDGFNTISNQYRDIYANAPKICAYARGTKVAGSWVTGLSSYGRGTIAGTYGYVGYYGDATNPGSLPPGGNKFILNELLSYEVGSQLVRCQLDIYGSNINDTIRDCAVYLNNTNGCQFPDANSATFTGPNAINTIGNEGIGLCVINSVNNNFGSLWITTDQSNTGLLYIDAISVADNTFSNTQTYYSATTPGLTSGVVAQLGPTGAGTSTGWIVPMKFMYPMYWTAFCDSAPGAGQTFKYQLFKFTLGSNVPIGPEITISGTGTFTTGIVQPYGYVSKMDSVFLRITTSAGAATANHRCLIHMRY